MRLERAEDGGFVLEISMPRDRFDELPDELWQAMGWQPLAMVSLIVFSSPSSHASPIKMQEPSSSVANSS